MALLTESTAVHRRPAGIIRVSGHDRLEYLNNLLSQDLAAPRPGSAADFLYLDPKGNAQVEGRAVLRAGDVLLVTPPAVAAEFVAALNRFTFLLDAAAEDWSDEWALASVRGSDTDGLPGARSQPMTAAPHGGGMVVRDRSGGVDYLGPRAWVDECVTDLGLPEAGAQDWEAWRIRAGLPGWGQEVVAGYRTQELGLLPTHVHLRKGCYPGQESIAKTYNLGRPRRALCVVEFDGAVEAGAELHAGDKTGKVTSAAPTENGSVALAILPVDRDGALHGGGEVKSGSAAGRVVRRVGEGLPQPGA